MPILDKNPVLKDFQEYVTKLEYERGFIEQSLIEKCLLLGEEVGELFKAVRKENNISIDRHSNINPISDELADIFIYLCAIANRCNIDLEEAFRAKEEINKQRKWE